MAFRLKYREILGNCGFLQLPIRKDIFQVQADIVDGGIKEITHLPLCQSDHHLLEPHIPPHLTVRGRAWQTGNSFEIPILHIALLCLLRIIKEIYRIMEANIQSVHIGLCWEF